MLWMAQGLWGLRLAAVSEHSYTKGQTPLQGGGGEPPKPHILYHYAVWCSFRSIDLSIERVTLHI